MTRYPIDIEVIYEMKNHEFKISSITNSLTDKQVTVRIINEYVISTPNDGSQTSHKMF
jgi:hypothetical protein